MNVIIFLFDILLMENYLQLTLSSQYENKGLWKRSVITGIVSHPLLNVFLWLNFLKCSFQLYWFVYLNHLTSHINIHVLHFNFIHCINFKHFGLYMYFLYPHNFKIP